MIQIYEDQGRLNHKMYELHGYQPNHNKRMHQQHSLIGYMFEAYQ
jgi:hypothetical protein